jgi:hypothetical protein
LNILKKKKYYCVKILIKKEIMKKLFTILCAVMLTISLSAQRQGDTKFGLVAGMNVAYPVGNDMEDFIDYWEDYIEDYNDPDQISDASGGVNPRIGMHLGAAFDYFLANNLALSSGLIYSQKGFVMRQKFTDINTGVTGESTKYDFKFATQLDYIDIPFGVKYATDEGFEISGGLIISILASDKFNATATEDGENYDEYFDDDYEWEDYEDVWNQDPEKTLTGLQAAVGYTFNEKFTISFKVQKTSNFGAINSNDDNQNLTLQLSTGISF